MSFSESGLSAKLSTLNETQDSIVSVSQWIMFHKRHADRIASYWLTRLRDSPPAKRLNFIYLVNDIVQNARARKRTEFPDAFSPLMAEAIQTAYRSSPADVQGKIRRVVEVWRTRNVFEAPILEAIEARIDEIDKSKGSGGKKTLMGNSLFSSSASTGMPKELETLAPLQIAVTKETISARPAIDAAQAEYTKLNDPAAVLPSPPVHAARLSGLIKSLAAAESSVSASIKARKALVADLERILEINKAALAKDEQTYLDLQSRKISTEAKKREVEDSIIRGLSAVDSSAEAPSAPGGVHSPGLDNNGTGGGAGAGFVERPEIEELTPEPEFPETDFASGNGGPFDHSNQAAPQQTTSDRPSNPAVAEALAGFSGGSDEYSPLASNLGGGLPYEYPSSTASRVRVASGTGSNGLGSKKRKLSHGGDADLVPDLGEMGMEGFGETQKDTSSTQAGANAPRQDLFKSLDEDVDELLRQEGGSSY
ncbi:hypothetical protein ABEF92_002830 [Exophiala dermatitidis]|uniref:CID domain-containing protein n=1 Tax=Exophiala dermatitidis (strain ATCC 34100 / CBS 525.76 / NIH/UT8656) TaxID=858893 RepID=H6C2Y1_EXODN|nr:uncharacterized protein HMPREF1120_06014 [Exophiala dermatitidis NIH/UT8656]EHY57996.1 hypothetical protein HMPREF1120_06014 [Exophiala dermatitidis NIH/UT8656]